MVLLQQVGAGVVFVLLTLCLQCVGVAALVTWLRKILTREVHNLRMSYAAALVMQAAIAIIILQGLAILLWAGCYRWLCFSSWQSAFYYSASSYSTVGYGDLVIPAQWRLLGPLESITGVLMCGISVSLLFTLVSRLVAREAPEAPQELGTEPPVAQRHG
ncbi:MAG TPA: potassium channel family protein [Terriglobales bacterium]|nr:potassium channel family protein [Terriglobales bacterium]